MAKTEFGLCDRDGPPYSPDELGIIRRLKDPDGTLRMERKRGTGPPFYREGRKRSRIFYPRDSFWRWYDERTFTSQAAADAADEVAR